MDKLEEFEKIAIELAIKCGETILHACSKDLEQIERKETWRDLVTEYDQAIEKFIFDSLRSRYPDHVFIGEESCSSTTSSSNRIESDAPTWIVDPIDGTINFVHRYPMCCVSIGLAINKQLVLGVINVPFLGKLYSAVKGKGAKCNGVLIKVSNGVKTIEKSLVLNDFIVSKQVDQSPPYLRKVYDGLLWKAQSVRMVGSACIALALIAEGVGDIFWHTSLCIWDMAAGAVIVTEAGGTVLTINGDTFDPHTRTIIATCNELLAKQVSSVTSFTRAPTLM